MPQVVQSLSTIHTFSIPPVTQAPSVYASVEVAVAGPTGVTTASSCATFPRRTQLSMLHCTHRHCPETRRPEGLDRHGLTKIAVGTLRSPPMQHPPARSAVSAQREGGEQCVWATVRLVSRSGATGIVLAGEDIALQHLSCL